MQRNKFSNSKSPCHNNGPTTFGLNPTYRSVAEMVWRVWRWPPVRPSLISEWNDLSNSESLHYSDASHQVTADMTAILDIGMECYRAILNHHVPKYLPTSLDSIWLRVPEQMWFQDLWPPSWISEQNAFIYSKSLCAPMLPVKFWLNPTYGLGDVVWRISGWPPWRPSLISEQNDFSISEFVCRFEASHQVSNQSELRFGSRCRLKYFKMATMAAILDMGMERF